MSTKTVQDDKIRARFSHMGLVVKDIEMMEDFYTNTIGFERTDGGMTTQRVIMIFMTLDLEKHHQVFLVEGRPDELPSNTIVKGGGPSIHHLAFRLESLSDLRKMYKRISDEYDAKIFTGTTATAGQCTRPIRRATASSFLPIHHGTSPNRS